MTERALRELFATWQGRLGLGAWQIEIRLGGCEDRESMMEVHRSGGYERAVVFVAPWVLSGQVPPELLQSEMTDEEVARCAVHELLHCHTRDMRSVLVEDLDGMLHPDAHQLAVAAVTRAEEVTVDRLAVALVAAWPE